MTGPLLAVDGPFILYRSFFALPSSIVGTEGRPVNGLLGATNLLLRAVEDYSPRAVVVCFGAEAAEYRVAAYPGYHAERPPVPEPLQWQFEAAPELFAAFGWTSQSAPTLEADDVMHALAQAETEAGGKSLILSGDRDMYQSASDSVTVLFLKMGGAGFQEVDPAEVEDRYGIPPALVPDFIALRGDPSDGLPGAPGIGAKTAADLLRRHGSLEAAIERAEGERPRVAASLRDNGADLRKFRDIATLRAIEVDRPADRATDLVGGAEAARRHGMRKLAERLGSGGVD
ncbi:MAG TPA: 5'-3' exonuclease [Solirubrobacteraceae bacterium]|jgi:DNA polymerase-1|nr:5'-3' exonuclease [Solirubrobacteraceae bacterium]